MDKKREKRIIQIELIILVLLTMYPSVNSRKVKEYCKHRGAGNRAS